jgi:hypothetical protein
MDYKVIALALDRVDGKFVVGGELVMLSSTGEVMWRSRPTFMDDDGFIGVSLWEGKLVAETWSSRSATLDPKTGQIIQSSFTK